MKKKETTSTAAKPGGKNFTALYVDEAPETFLFPVADLKFNKKNPRKITPVELERLKESITEFKKMLWLRPVVIDENNLVLGGTQRATAAGLLQMISIPVTRAVGLTEEEKKEFIIKDNRSAGEWDYELLRSEWNSEKLNAWGVEMPGAESWDRKIEAATEDNYTAPEKIETDIVHGDRFEIGAHVLLCGDSQDAGAVAKLCAGKTFDLLFTDPPYGVSAGGGRSQTVEKLNMKEIKNDDLRGERLQQFITSCLSLAPLKNESSIYICYDHKTQFEFTAAVRALQWYYQNTIVWNKNVFGLSGHKGYRPKFELIMFCSTEQNYKWHAGNDQANVWDIARPNAKEREGNHRTPKPVLVPARAIQNSTAQGEFVLDLFAGVGSTMVACEQLNRICYAMEYEPEHCQSIIDRMKKLVPGILIKKNGVEI